MENNEVKNEVIEEVSENQDILVPDNNKKLYTVVGLAIFSGVAYLAWRFAIKPAAKKIKEIRISRKEAILADREDEGENEE